MTWRILCETADLAVQSLTTAELIGLQVETSVEPELVAAAVRALAEAAPVALVAATQPDLISLVELAHGARNRTIPLALALPVPHARRAITLDVAGDLGLCAVHDLRPLMAALALLEHGAWHAHAASVRALSALDRARMRAALTTSTKTAGQLVPVDTARIGWSEHATGAVTTLGEARDVADALLSLRNTERSHPTMISSVEGVDPNVVLDVIFGPRRALSDPASKAALAPYGIPLPVEELCASPSRAAAEATRIGFPVRISLASPDLRVWNHPDLSVDMVDNAARVRDTFRQLMAAAESRLDTPGDGRLLGVMVTATSESIALLGVRAFPLPHSRVGMEIGFADPHGLAAEDMTICILPADASVIERGLRRLSGSSLIFNTSAAARRLRMDSIFDVLLRVAAFVHDRRAEIESVEIRPLALTFDGGTEIREACVTVNDGFERTLQGAALSGTRTK